MVYSVGLPVGSRRWWYIIKFYIPIQRNNTIITKSSEIVMLKTVFLRNLKLLSYNAICSPLFNRVTCT